MKAEANIGARLLAVPSSDLTEALGKRGALDPGIRRLTGGKLAGRAVTARCERYTVGAMLQALRIAGEGDVLCVQGEGDWAYFGELTAAEAIRRGLAGVVVDGLVRDVEGIARLGLSLFARGTIPVGGTPRVRGTVNKPLRISAEEVVPGDWVVGDADGLVVVSAAEVDAALAAAEANAAAERNSLARIAAGESFFEIEFHGGPPLGSLLDKI